MRFQKWLEETTTTAGVAQNLAKGQVDVIGAKGKCPDGMTWDAKQLECVPDIKMKKEAKKIKIGFDQEGYDKLVKYFMDKHGLSKREAKKKADKYKTEFRTYEEKKECPEGHEWDEKMQECLPSSTGIKEEKKDCPDGHEWDEKTQECLPKISKLKEALMEVSMKNVPKEYMKDPLYKKVLMAKNRAEYNKALDTLKQIRGETAVKKFVNKMKSLKEAKKPRTPEEHQLKIAKDTMKMTDAMAKIMGGMTKEEAKKIIEKFRKKGKK